MKIDQIIVENLESGTSQTTKSRQIPKSKILEPIITEFIRHGKDKELKKFDFVQKKFGFETNLIKELKKDYFWNITKFLFVGQKEINSNKKAFFITFVVKNHLHKIINLNENLYKHNPLYEIHKIREEVAKTLNQVLTSIRENFQNQFSKKLSFISSIEFHKDFTPHMHVLFFVPEENYDGFTNFIHKSIFENYEFNQKLKESHIQKVTSEEEVRRKSFYMLKELKKASTLIPCDTSKDSNCCKKQNAYLYNGWKLQTKIKPIYRNSRLPIPRVVFEKITNFLMLDYKKGDLVEQILSTSEVISEIYEISKYGEIKSVNRKKVIQNENSHHTIIYKNERKENPKKLFPEIENRFITPTESKKNREKKYTKSYIFKLAWRLKKLYKIEISEALKLTWKISKISARKRALARQERVFAHNLINLFKNRNKISEEPDLKLKNLFEKIYKELFPHKNKNNLENLTLDNVIKIYRKELKKPRYTYAIKYISIFIDKKENITLFDKRMPYEERIAQKEEFEAYLEQKVLDFNAEFFLRQRNLQEEKI